MEKGFFEFLALADAEKVHSQIIAWMFSEHCDALTNLDKIFLASELSGLPIKSDIIYSIAETENIDILIETNDNRIIIENKLKSSQHSLQLSKYYEKFSGKENKRSSYVF